MFWYTGHVGNLSFGLVLNGSMHDSGIFIIGMGLSELCAAVDQSKSMYEN